MFASSMAMGEKIKCFSIFKRRQEEKPSQTQYFLQNGSLLQEKLIAASNVKYDISIRSFTAEELIRSTNNFVEQFHSGRFSYMCRGFWQGRQILVKKCIESITGPSDANYDILSGEINDIAITAQMGRHKNVLKILGCCLDFKHPALVYDYSGGERLDRLINSKNTTPLTWKTRMKIAGDIANVILYLHTAFPTPIVYRILSPWNIIIDNCGTAKLFNFSFSIALPPGKLQIEDDVIGVTGYIDYDYYTSGIVSQKTDVYGFGVLLLVLLTGQEAICRDEDEEGVGQIHILQYVKDRVNRNELNRIVDPNIIQGREELENFSNSPQLQAFLDLTFRCTQDMGKNRPNMIDVAKELLGIRRCFQDP